MQPYGYGKRRAWCDRCHSLKDRTRFRRLYWQPHPDSETGLYYDGWVEWACDECVAKLKPNFMPKREYEKRLRATLRKAFGEVG